MDGRLGHDTSQLQEGLCAAYLLPLFPWPVLKDPDSNPYSLLDTSEPEPPVDAEPGEPPPASARRRRSRRRRTDEDRTIMDGGLESDGPSLTENGLGEGVARPESGERTEGCHSEYVTVLCLPQKRSPDPSVVIEAADAATVATGLMGPSVETGSQVSQLCPPEASWHRWTLSCSWQPQLGFSGSGPDH